jgi:hypothetical protein
MFAWGIYGADALSLLINTSSCQFNSTPLYFTSFGGITDHFGLVSYTAIPSSTSFTIYINSIFDWSAAQMLNISITGDRSVNWLGIIY